jgi:DNA-binding CsgD family transcriptional regulator
MPRENGFFDTVDAILAAGLDEALWPAALGQMTNLFGSFGTTFETVDRTLGRMTDFWSYGIPTGSELTYAEHYMLSSPRMKLANWHRPGDVGFDRLVIDEAGMKASEYYAEFLAGLDMRYFISITVIQNAREIACVAVQRSPREGHAEKREIEQMVRLVPHVRQAFDTSRRLRKLAGAGDMFEQALDWLPEAVLLMRGDGIITYLNAAARQCVRGNDIKLKHGRLDFQMTAARARLDAALAAIQRRDSRQLVGGDFAVPRAGGKPPYMISVRPVVDGGERLVPAVAQALAIVFIRDPLVTAAMPAGRMARDVFGLTEAETAFADALARGISATDYARSRNVSMNTVYTHLRHLKAKTGAKRMSELVAKLAEMKAALLEDEQRGEALSGD